MRISYHKLYMNNIDNISARISRWYRHLAGGLFFGVSFLVFASQLSAQDRIYQEQNRPQFHFTPKANWINDPNGLVYINGKYHLYYQYYPKAINWGPMHWGHAISKDLLHWKELPIALYPDSLGYIFSGSAVYDKNNTSGLGTKARPPVVAIFTHHDPAKEKAGKTDVESQSIAFSLDEGITWTKFKGNPVVKNPGVRDFRDPKVFWYAEQNKWVMVVAASDRVRLYDSENLINWREISQFGSDRGSHGSVWECPDLFPLKAGKETKWVMTVCEGNGGPNKGSAIQYFVGDFNGKDFVSSQKKEKWLEYGPDDYAGNTWNNTDGQRLYIGWMTNLMYAGNVPATSWRGEMTLPRKLGLSKIGANYFLIQQPIAAVKKEIKSKIGVARISGTKPEEVSLSFAGNGQPVKIDVEQKKQVSSFELALSNSSGDTLKLGFDPAKKQYYIDRGGLGHMDFASGMNPVIWSPKIGESLPALEILVDRNSIEVFADGGLTVMTALFYPAQPGDYFNRIQLDKPGNPQADTKISLNVFELKSVWPVQGD